MDVINRILPINSGQTEAIKEIMDFIDNGNPDSWFTLEGKAGTGKTTIITNIIGKCIGKKRVVISALSHKAKKVLWDKAMDLYSDNTMGLSSNSVASLLGMSMDLENGNFTKAYSKKVPPIRWPDIIIVDEASMINEEALTLIMSQKKKKAKVIFLGDVGQLPPIREQGDSNIGKNSPVFESINKVTLHDRVRQKVDSDILPYSDFYWKNSVLNDGEDEDPIPLESRKDKNGIKFSKNLETTLKECEHLFKKMVTDNEPNIIKVICYRNKTKKALNWFIRNLIFKEPKEFELGDVVMMNSNYYRGTDLIMENAAEGSIVKIENKKFSDKYNGFKMDVYDGVETKEILVMSETSLNDWNKHISELFNKAKLLSGRSRNNALKLAWDTKKKFADIDHSYALTSHKSQGSTYNHVVVIEDDILNVGLINNVEKSQSLYVAITRASEMVYIISSLN